MRIAVIPDTQCKPGQSFEHLAHVGRYIAEHRPDVVVHLGDHADMESLSSYDKGKRQFEGRRYWRDIDAAKRGMEALVAPIARARGYSPRMVFCLGNHEYRIQRLVDLNPEFEGDKSFDDLGYADFGWDVRPFLAPVTVSGTVFAHYLVSGVMQRPITSAAALLAKRHMSAVVGHQQGLQIATATRADGRLLTGVICGSCYVHNEEYMGPQGNSHFRGMLMLNDVRAHGEFDLMPVTLRYLRRRYGR